MFVYISLLACLNTNGFLEGCLFKALSGFKKAGLPERPLFLWTCKQTQYHNTTVRNLEKSFFYL